MSETAHRSLHHTFDLPSGVSLLALPSILKIMSSDISRSSLLSKPLDEALLLIIPHCIIIQG